MSSTSPRQGLSKTLRSIKARFIVGLSLVLLAAVFSASALTANLNGPEGQQAGSFAASIFSLFGSSDDRGKTSRGETFSPEDLDRWEKAWAAARQGDDVSGEAPAVTFTNPAAITIPANGAGSPYPSAIAVSGLTGSVATVTVTINGFSHTFPDDVGMALVGPGGQAYLLQDAVGDSTDAVNLTYTISDAGATALPGSGLWANNGTFRPAAYILDNFPGPGPGTTYANPGPVSSGSATLNGTFGGSNPNGTWNLFVGDFFTGDAGSISGGWSIDITTNSCAAPPANMVAWFPGEVSTDDIIGDPANNGTFQGSGAYTTGVVGNGFNMTGANNVQVPTSAALNVGAAGGISVDAWIRPTTLTQQAIVEWERGAGSGTIGAHFYQSVNTPGDIYVNLTDTAGVNHIFRTTAGVLTAGANQHVAFTYDKTTGGVAIYRNGVAQTITTANVGTGFTPGTGGSMYIGRRSTGGDFFNGVIDEVEIFSRALTGAEVASISTAAGNGKCHVSQIQFDTAAQSVPENGGPAVTTLKRVGANDSTATVAYNVANGTATGGGVDYGNASTSTVTFSPGERTQTVSVPIIDDAIDEPNETFTATVSLPTGAGVSIGVPQTQTITIVDNDAVPNITINNAAGVEGTPPGAGGSATFTVTKTGATTFASSVVVTPASGTATGGASCATAGVDFVNTATTLNFPASTTTDTQNVTVNFCPDSAIEGDEGFTMVLVPTGATAGAAGTGNIQDDDSSVQFTLANYTVTEGNTARPATTTATMVVSRTGTGTGLPAAQVDASTIGAATATGGFLDCNGVNSDFVIVSGTTISWAAGDATNKNFNILVCQDTIIEADETFSGDLSNPVNTQIGAQGTAVMTITNDDGAAVFNFSSTTALTQAEGTTFAYGVTRSFTGSTTGTDLTSTVNFSTAGTSALPATVPGDVGPTTGTVAFAAGGVVTNPANFVSVDDTLFEPTEQFTGTLTSVTGNGSLGGTVARAGNITDNDAAPVFRIRENRTQVEGNSGTTAMIFDIDKVSGDAQYAQTVRVFTTDGGGPTAATAPSDYTAISGVPLGGDPVIFAQGQTTAQFAVIINGDTTFEDDETFTTTIGAVTILNSACPAVPGTNPPCFASSIGTPAFRTGTIINDDAAPVFNLTATVGTPNETVTEGSGAGTTVARFTITKTGATALTSVVSGSTVNGTAVAPGDFTAITNAALATFAPADLTKTFDVNIVRDTIREGTETFAVNLTNVTNGTFGTPTTGTGTINDDEPNPNFVLSAVSASNPEGTAASFLVTMNFPTGLTGTEVSSTLSCASNVISANSTIDAQSGDFAVAANSIVFAAGSASGSTQPCSFATTNDTVFEGPENFNVALTGSSGALGTITGTPQTATIVNNDACTFVTSNVTQNEGNAGTSQFIHNVAKTCDTGTFNGLVGYDSTDGTATNPSDYTEIIPGTLNFTPSTTSLPLPVSVNGDLLVEPDETYNVRLTGATVNGVPVPNGACGTATCGLANGVGTITNDDGMPISISGTITNFSPAGPAAGVTVTLSGSSAATTTTNASGAYTFTGLPSGGNFLVTPTAPAGFVASPTTRSYTGITASVTTANFVLYSSTAIPRTLNVVNSYAVPGSPVTVPITLTAQGDEAALSGTLTYAAPLSGPTVACGTGSPLCSLTSNTSTPGVITFTVEAQDGGGNPTVYAAGTRIVINVTFNTSATTAANAPVNFANAPTQLRTSDPGSNPLPTVYNNGFVVFQQGLESDVAPRPSGDGSLASADVIQTRRFVANLDTPNPSTNEFQRADAAPAGTRGDGNLNASDVIQARRYAAALDPTQSAGGPFVAVGPRIPMDEKGGDLARGESVNTILRTVNVSGNQGTQVFVDVELDSVLADDVAGFGTSFTFDNTKVSISSVSGGANPDVTLGTATVGCTITTNGSQVAVGRIGFVLDCGTAIAPGTNRQVARLRFTIGPSAPAGLTPVNLVGAPPIAQSMSNTTGGNVTFTNQNGNINIILNPTAAGVTVGGRVTTPTGAGLRGAIVSITDGEGNRRSVTTSTFGYYQFEDVEAGGNYVVAVSSRRFRFAPRLIQVIDNLSDVDFIGQE